MRGHGLQDMASCLNPPPFKDKAHVPWDCSNYCIVRKKRHDRHGQPRVVLQRGLGYVVLLSQTCKAGVVAL